MYDRFFKRLLDLLLALGGGLVLCPLLVVIGLLVRFPVSARERGPIFFHGERIGRSGIPFRIIKFRSMIVDADRMGPSSTAADDPRLTTTGRFLRKYKLDELPQLLNVISGDMSLVGPRPEVRRFVELFTEEERLILDLRPGITDWSSLAFPNEEEVLDRHKNRYPDADAAYAAVIRPRKLALQLDYVRRHGLWVDLKILLLTVLAVLGLNKSQLDPAVAEE